MIARSLTLDQLVTGLLDGSINTEVRTVPLPWEDPKGAAEYEALRAARRKEAKGEASFLAAPRGDVAEFVQQKAGLFTTSIFYLHWCGGISNHILLL